MTERTITPQGLGYGLGAYLLWGLLPLYLALTAPATAAEIVVLRVGFTLVVCLILLAVVRRFGDLWRLLRSGRRLAGVTVAALLVFGNWALYTFTVVSGHTLEAALGYFINPLISVLMGVLFLQERLRRGQWLAVGIGAVAVVVMGVGLGQVPWLGLSIAATFGLYGLAKNRLGVSVHPVASLAAETVVLMPLHVAGVVWLGGMGGLTVLSHGAGHFWILAASGVVTAVPLILFGAAAGRLPLSVVGLLQFITPVMQFLVALLVFHEPMPVERWAGFILVWVALAVLTADSLGQVRRQRRGGAHRPVHRSGVPRP